MGILDNKEYKIEPPKEGESTYLGDAFKGAVTGVADVPVKGVNAVLDAIDYVLPDYEGSDERVQLPSADPVITDTVDNPRTFSGVRDVTRTVAGGVLLRRQLGLTGGSTLAGQGATIGVTDALASAGLNELDNEHLFLDKAFGETTEGSTKRKMLNVAEEAIIGTTFEIAVPYVGRGIKKFLSSTSASKIEGATSLFTKGDPEKTRAVTDAEIPSSSVGTDLNLNDDLATGGVPLAEVPDNLRADVHKARKVSNTKKRKKRQAKKLSTREQVVENMKIKEVEDTLPKGVVDDPAKVVDDYETNKLISKEITEEVQEVRFRAKEGTLSAEDQEYADLFMKGIDRIGAKKQGRLNPKTAGDNYADGTVRVAQQLAESAGFVKKAVKQSESVTQAFRRLWDSDTGKIEETYRLTFGDASRETILANSAQIEKMGYDSAVVYTQGRVLRSTLIREATESIDNVLTKGVDDLTPEEMRDFVSSLLELDKLDSHLQGYISQVGRILNLQKVNPTELQSKLIKAHGDVVQNKAQRAKSMQNVTDTMTMLNGNKVTKADRKKIKNLATRLKGKDLSKGNLADTIKSKSLIDLYLNNLIGGVLSGPVTLVRSVMVGGLVNTMYKSLLAGNIRHILHGGNPLKRTRAMFQTAMRATKLQRDSYDTMSKVLLDTETDYTSLLSATGKKTASGKKITAGEVIRADLDAMVDDLLADGKKIQAGLVGNKITEWITYTSGLPIRAMKGLDNYIKTVNLAGDLETEALIRYAQDNTDKLFGESVSFDEFRKRYIAQAGEMTQLMNKGDVEGLEKLTKGMHQDVVDEMQESIRRANQRASETTFQETLDDAPLLGWLNKTLNNAKTSDSSVLKVSGTMFFPFTKSALNGTRTAVEGVPLVNMVSKRMRNKFAKAVKEKDKEAMKDLLALQVAGTTAFVGMGVLVNSTEITGTQIPDNLSHHPHIKPRSVRVGDTFVSYDGLGSLTTLLSSHADYKNLKMDASMPIDSEKDGELLMDVTMSTIANLGSDTGMGGIKDLGSLVATGGNAKTGVLNLAKGKLIMMTTPLSGAQRAFGDLVEGATGKEKRITANEAEDTASELLASILNGAGAYNPQWSALGSLADGVGVTDLEYTNKVDTLGRDSDFGLGKALGHVLGARTSQATDDDVLRAMSRYGEIPDVFSSNRTGDIEGIPMTYSQERRVRKNTYLGENGMIKSVRDKMRTGAWANMSPTDRKDHLKSIKSTTQKHAKELMKVTDDFAPKIAEKQAKEYIQRFETDKEFDDSVSKDVNKLIEN